MTSLSRYEPSRRRNKFGAVKTVLDGITFDSKREAAYYAELKLRERAGEVASVELQPVYELSVNGHLVGTYRPDFRFYDVREKRVRVVDVKGVRTREFQRTVRLMRAIHKVEVEVVK